VRWPDFMRQRQQRYQNVFGSPDGEWVLADLAKECGFGQDPYSKGDSHATTYLVGRAFPILHIRAVLDMSHAEMARIVKIQEESERRQQEEPFR